MDIKLNNLVGAKIATVGKICVNINDSVEKDQVLLQVETKKGNKPIKAESQYTIKEICCEEGQEVTSGDLLFKVDEETQTSTPHNTCSMTNPYESESKQMQTDLLIIGAGPGGYVAAIYAAKKGIKVTLIEKEYMGGTCLNVGCIPTKALVKSSEVCHSANNADEFGINVSDVVVDMDKVISHKNQVKNQLVSGIDFLMQKNNVNVIKGLASFIDTKTVSVVSTDGTYTINAKDIIIATGSKISKSNIPGLDLPFVLNSTSALDDTKLPKSITIIGGGVIGMEFAFIYSNFGVKVYVVEYMDRLLACIDSDMSNEITQIAQDRGIKIYSGSKVLKIDKSENNEVIVVFEKDGKESLIVSEKVLVAIGREPNMDGLVIENTGVTLNARGRGIQVNSKMQTNIEHIYAIGDVTNIMQLAHVASHQGLIAVNNILGEESEMDYSVVPNVIFTAPEIALVGKTEQMCKAEGVNYKVSSFPFSANGKALTMNEPRGFIKIIKDLDKNRIVGGAIIGPDASSLISSLTIVIQNNISEDEIIHTIFPHPTTGEVIHEATLGLSIGALHE